jgi:hypothetical protein
MDRVLPRLRDINNPQREIRERKWMTNELRADWNRRSGRKYIWLNDVNAVTFQTRSALRSPVTIGDQYTDGVFTRADEPVLTFTELLAAAESPEE